MPAGNLVRPKKWKDVINLYDDGTYSAIWGTYDDSSQKSLGVRWNGISDYGYPNQGVNPLWYVEPEFTTKMILLEFLSRVNSKPDIGDIDNILIALKEITMDNETDKSLYIYNDKESYETGWLRACVPSGRYTIEVAGIDSTIRGCYEVNPGMPALKTGIRYYAKAGSQIFENFTIVEGSIDDTGKFEFKAESSLGNL